MKKRILSLVTIVTLLFGMYFNIQTNPVSATVDYQKLYTDYFTQNPEVTDDLTPFVFTEPNDDNIPELFVASLGSQTSAFTPVTADKANYNIKNFADVNTNDSYYDYIAKLGYINLFEGDDKGNFNPDKSLTRAECAALVCRMLGYKEEANNYKGQVVFNDVPGSHWASGYVYVASKLGIINGYGNGKFGPQDPVLYEQAIKMVLCAIEYNQPVLCASYGISCPNDEIPYPQGYVQLAQRLGMYGECSQREQAPRKIIAELLYRAILKNGIIVTKESNGNVSCSANGDSLLKKIFGIESEDTLTQLVPKVSTNPVPPVITPTPPTVTSAPISDTRTIKLEELINIDYATLKLLYGMPEVVTNFPRGGIGYKFRGNDALFLFTDTWQILPNDIYSDSEDFPEPSAFAVCERIFTDIGNWLQTEERGLSINSIEDVQNYGPIKHFNYYCDEYSGEENYVGEKDWYNVWITYDEERYPITADSELLIGPQWSLWTDSYTRYASNISEDKLKEQNGLYFCRNQSELYKADKNLSGTVVIPEGVVAICADAFKDCQNIQEIVLPRTLVTIGRSAFENCTALKKIKIPTGVQFIDPDAFTNCDSLEFIKIPQSVIGGIPSGMYSGIIWDIFEDCDNLKSVVLLTSAKDRKYQFRIADHLPPIENLVIGGNIDAIPFGYLSAAKRGYLKNLYICFEINGIIGDDLGSYYGSALLIPENIYYTGTRARISRLPELKFNEWKNKDIVCNYNDFDNPYLVECLSEYFNPLKIMVNHQLLVPEYPSIYQNNTYYADAESFFSYLGMSNSTSSQKFTAKGNANTVSFTIGQSSATVNDKSVALGASVITVNDRIYFPIKPIIDAIGDNVIWSKDQSTVQFDFLKFQEVNEDALETLLRTDYTFDTLYQEYTKDPDAAVNADFADLLKLLDKNSKDAADQDYVDYLTAMLTDALIDSESTSTYLHEGIMKDYELAESALGLMGKDASAILTAGMKASDEYCKKMAIKNAKNRYEASLDLWYQSTDNENLKTAIQNVKKIMNQSFDEILDQVDAYALNQIGNAFTEKIKSNTLKLLGLAITDIAKSFTDAVSEYLDSLLGERTKYYGYSELTLVMPIRYELQNLIANNYEKIMNGKHYAEDGTTELTTATAGLSSMLRAILVYSSKQANAIYNAERNSGSDMICRVFKFGIESIYENKFDILYNEEMKLFKDAIVVNQISFE